MIKAARRLGEAVQGMTELSTLVATDFVQSTIAGQRSKSSHGHSHSPPRKGCPHPGDETVFASNTCEQFRTPGENHIVTQLSRCILNAYGHLLACVAQSAQGFEPVDPGGDEQALYKMFSTT
jgi:hypothetical protein